GAPWMSRQRGSHCVQLECECFEDRIVPSSAAWQLETFESIASGQIPANWSQWTNEAGKSISVANPFGFNVRHSMRSAGQRERTTWIALASAPSRHALRKRMYIRLILQFGPRSMATP